jgi:PAS domain S-box-containing protein
MLTQKEYQIKLSEFSDPLDRITLMNKYAWDIRRSFPAQTLQIAQEALEQAKILKDKKQIAFSYMNSGTAYYLLSVYESGIIDLNKARELFNLLNEKQAEADCIRNIGNIYHSINEFEKSIALYNNAIELCVKLNDKLGIGYNLGNIGYVHFLNKRYDKALEYMFKTRDLLIEVDDALGLADVLNNIGKSYFELKDENKAFEYFQQSLEKSNEINHLRGIANASTGIGVYHFHKNDFENSICFLSEALSNAEQMGEKSLISEIAKKLSETYEKSGDLINALKYYKKYDSLNNEVASTSSKGTITAIQAQFDLEQAEKEKEIFKIRNVELANIQKELEEKNDELERLSIVASQTDNVILIMDSNGIVEWINESFTKLNGVTLQELKAERGNSIYEISNNPKIKNIIQDCIKNKKSVVYESLNITKEGNRVWEASTLTPIFDNDGKLRKLIIIDSDVTDRKVAEEIIKQKNKDITDSINYAKRIQQAILPDAFKIKSYLPESFILFKPKDIVSGDFYWFDKIDNHIIFAVADCTGHGVPGALMSMIGIDILTQVTNDSAITSPSATLELLDVKVKKALKQTGENNETTDGMDIAFCEFIVPESSFNENLVLNYSGAYRPLWLIRDKKIIEYKGDKYNIGGHNTGTKIFTHHTIPINKGDVIYLFTDGCTDLFGGKSGKKFKTRRLKDLLLQIHTEPIQDQEKILSNTFDDWRGTFEQVDDLLIVGVKF